MIKHISCAVVQPGFFTETAQANLWHISQVIPHSAAVRGWEHCTGVWEVLHRCSKGCGVITGIPLIIRVPSLSVENSLVIEECALSHCPSLWDPYCIGDDIGPLWLLLIILRILLIILRILYLCCHGYFTRLWSRPASLPSSSCVVSPHLSQEEGAEG